MIRWIHIFSGEKPVEEEVIRTVCDLEIPLAGCKGIVTLVERSKSC